MKKSLSILLIGLMGLLFSSCNATAPGTLEDVDQHNDSIEVYKYYYKTGCYIYITFYKGQQVPTATWTEKHGKTSSTYANAMVAIPNTDYNLPTAKSFTIESIKDKGVVISKESAVAIIQTKTDLVKVQIPVDILELISVGDTIK